jgi:hypothetical protein
MPDGRLEAPVPVSSPNRLLRAVLTWPISVVASVATPDSESTLRTRAASLSDREIVGEVVRALNLVGKIQP